MSMIRRRSRLFRCICFVVNTIRPVAAISTIGSPIRRWGGRHENKGVLMKRANKIARKIGLLLAVAVLVGIGLANVPVVAQANSTPIALPSSSIVPTVLTAGNATMSSGLTVFTTDANAYYWVNNFNSSSSTLTWSVSASSATTYSVTGIFSAPNGTPFTVTDSGNGNSFSYTTTTDGWENQTLGTIAIPQGTSNVTLSRSTSTSTETDIKSLEFLPNGSLTAYNQSVSNAKVSSQWLTNAGYGLFLQYGGWGFPKSGAAKTLNDQACDFNVQNFVNLVQSTGAGYVVWSYTWWTYQADGPNSAIDSIAGNTTHTATCDLDLKVAQALHAIGVKFLLYYHNGHGTDPTWFSEQGYPAGHGTTGAGDMTTFNSNWTNIVENVGNDLGTNLDGWWIDDGSYYYPDDFASLESALRAGNSNRIVTFNSWEAAKFTNYEDYSPGETCSSGLGSGTVDSTGIYTNGPQVGLRAQCLYMMNQDWGVHAENTAISAPNVSALETAATNAQSSHTAISLNLMMWEDGAIDPSTYDALQAVHHIFDPTSTLVNDTSSQITYGGTWGYSSGRGAGDLSDDVHYSTTAGSTASITFTGTGIDVLAPTDSGYGSATVSLDGTAEGTVSLGSTSVYDAQQVIYSVRGLSSGTHTLILTQASSGAYLEVDGFNTVNSGAGVVSSLVNDTSSQIAYGGTWGYSSGRGAGDFDNDLHYTTTAGSTATITFTGTGIDVLAPTDSGYGTASVTLDGVSKGTVNQATSSGYVPQQTTYSVRGLSSGSHTLVFTQSSSGSYFQIDAFDTVS